MQKLKSYKKQVCEKLKELPVNADKKCLEHFLTYFFHDRHVSMAIRRRMEASESWRAV